MWNKENNIINCYWVRTRKYRKKAVHIRPFGYNQTVTIKLWEVKWNKTHKYRIVRINNFVNSMSEHHALVATIVWMCVSCVCICVIRHFIGYLMVFVVKLLNRFEAWEDVFFVAFILQYFGAFYKITRQIFIRITKRVCLFDLKASPKLLIE